MKFEHLITIENRIEYLDALYNQWVAGKITETELYATANATAVILPEGRDINGKLLPTCIGLREFKDEYYKLFFEGDPEDLIFPGRTLERYKKIFNENSLPFPEFAQMLLDFDSKIRNPRSLHSSKDVLIKALLEDLQKLWCDAASRDVQQQMSVIKELNQKRATNNLDVKEFNQKSLAVCETLQKNSEHYPEMLRNLTLSRIKDMHNSHSALNNTLHSKNSIRTMEPKPTSLSESTRHHTFYKHNGNEHPNFINTVSSSVLSSFKIELTNMANTASSTVREFYNRLPKV